MHNSSRKPYTTEPEKCVFLPVVAEKGLKLFASQMWERSVKLGADMARGHRCDSVYATGPTQHPDLHRLGTAQPWRRPLFGRVQDYMELASPFSWVVRAPMFMQLACLVHHYDDLTSHVNTSLLRTTSNWDALIWTNWLHRHGIQHMGHFLPEEES